MARRAPWLLAALMIAAAPALAQTPETPQGKREPYMTGPNWPEPVFDSAPPKLPAKLKQPAILVFSKTNGYRDDAQIRAANAAIAKLVEARGWGVYVTENGALFNDQDLSRFKAVVFSSNSGDVFTAAQRQAFRGYLEKGGGFVGLHGSGGDPHQPWTWYVQSVIGARFIGHTYSPQFQTATIVVEDRTHPATRHLPERWRWTEEWYAFDKSPRGRVNVLANLDETGVLFQPRLVMGKDHPLIWWHCMGRARLFYSALGHKAETYAEPDHLKLIDGAIAWAARRDGKGCD
jgi:type 1 glutamine amidotransferase